MINTTKLLDEMQAAECSPFDTGVIHQCNRGQLARFRVHGDSPGTKNGWVSVFLDGEGAAFGNWKTGIKAVCFANDDRQQTADQAEQRKRKAALQRATMEAKRQRHAGHQAVAAKCFEQWNRARPADPDHCYLKTKQIKPLGLRQQGDALLVPITDGSGLISLQYIMPDGTKRFASGGRTKGGWLLIGQIADDKSLLICEGFATAASLYEMTGQPVAVAFNAGNLQPVAGVMRRKYPQKPIVICADRDRVGVVKGQAAADAVNGYLALPPLPDNVPGSDFNDYHRWVQAGSEA